MAMSFKVQNLLSCIESDKMSWTHDAKGPSSLFTGQLNDLTLPLLYIFLFFSFFPNTVLKNGAFDWYMAEQINILFVHFFRMSSTYLPHLNVS